MIYRLFIFGVLKDFCNFVKVAKLQKRRKDRLKDILHNLLTILSVLVKSGKFTNGVHDNKSRLILYLSLKGMGCFSYSAPRFSAKICHQNEKSLFYVHFFILNHLKSITYETL